jgi:hypothetical protein
VIEPDAGERFEARAIERHSSGDEIGVEPGLDRISEYILEIAPQRGLAAGKMQLQGAGFGRLAKCFAPFRCGQFRVPALELERIGAIGALQRAAMGELRQQSCRPTGVRPIGLCHRGDRRRREGVGAIAQQALVG